MFDVRMKIVSQKGECVFGHKLGDEWIVGISTPPGICNGAYNALYPFIRVLQFGGQYEWPPGSGTCQLCCPDPFNQIIFELSRVEESERKVWDGA